MVVAEGAPEGAVVAVAVFQVGGFADPVDHLGQTSERGSVVGETRVRNAETRNKLSKPLFGEGSRDVTKTIEG